MAEKGEAPAGPKGVPEGLSGSRFVGLGLTWTLSVLLFMGGGWWLDGRLGTTPLLTIVGAFIGAGGGFWYLIQEATGRPGRQKP